MLLPSTGLAAKFHKNNGETIAPIIEPVHSIQISSHTKLNFAKQEAAILSKLGFKVEILGIYDKKNKFWYVVFSGPYSSRQAATTHAAVISRAIHKKVFVQTLSNTSYQSFKSRVHAGFLSKKLSAKKTTFKKKSQRLLGKSKPNTSNRPLLKQYVIPEQTTSLKPRLKKNVIPEPATTLKPLLKQTLKPEQTTTFKPLDK
ncbi:MAG: SPOR domain-containing protein, partial [Magnetococcales bacterium]|nr:SPOR domain-containing protein [Magnetococcales bacterium]